MPVGINVCKYVLLLICTCIVMTDRFLFPVARLLETTISLNVFLSQYIPLIKHWQLKQF